MKLYGRRLRSIFEKGPDLVPILTNHICPEFGVERTADLVSERLTEIIVCEKNEIPFVQDVLKEIGFQHRDDEFAIPTEWYPSIADSGKYVVSIDWALKHMFLAYGIKEPK